MKSGDMKVGGDRPLNITGLMGGPSAEREVSLVSGEAIASALQCAGHNVSRRDISPADTSALDADDIDVVFIALHGDFGESGQVQQLCEARNLPYTGSGVQASELAMDKASAKLLFKRAALATANWTVVEKFHESHDVTERLEELHLPVVVKPVNGGSSVDITIALDAHRRDQAIEELLGGYSRALVEQYVDGRELTVGIVGERALPVIEIIPPGEFYDYRAKYTDCGTQYLFDHGLPADTIEYLQTSALLAHNVLNCRDMSRVDFLFDADGIAHVLEINTIPGFTGHSLLPMAAQRAGINFEQLVDSIAKMATNRRSDNISKAG